MVQSVSKTSDTLNMPSTSSSTQAEQFNTHVHVHDEREPSMPLRSDHAIHHATEEQLSLPLPNPDRVQGQENDLAIYRQNLDTIVERTQANLVKLENSYQQKAIAGVHLLDDRALLTLKYEIYRDIKTLKRHSVAHIKYDTEPQKKAVLSACADKTQAMELKFLDTIKEKEDRFFLDALAENINFPETFEVSLGCLKKMQDVFLKKMLNLSFYAEMHENPIAFFEQFPRAPSEYIQGCIDLDRMLKDSFMQFNKYIEFIGPDLFEDIKDNYRSKKDILEKNLCSKLKTKSGSPYMQDRTLSCIMDMRDAFQRRLQHRASLIEENVYQPITTNGVDVGSPSVDDSAHIHQEIADCQHIINMCHASLSELKTNYENVNRRYDCISAFLEMLDNSDNTLSFEEKKQKLFSFDPKAKINLEAMLLEEALKPHSLDESS
jgi:hypothetical protein